MSCKKPIIMAIDGVSRELINDANCGLYAEPENPSAFATQVRQYLYNPKLVKNHGENGYNFAKANFHRTELANEYLEHLENVSKISSKEVKTIKEESSVKQ